MDKTLKEIFRIQAFNAQSALYKAGLLGPDLSNVGSVEDFPEFRNKLEVAHKNLQAIIGDGYRPLELDEAKVDSAIASLEDGWMILKPEERASDNFSDIARAVFFSAQMLDRFPPTEEIAFKGYAAGLAGLISDLYHCSIAFERTGYAQKFFAPKTESGNHPSPAG
jgi:hypothetical protein